MAIASVWPGALSEREWVQDAYARYQNLNATNFLASSTPGAGKTRFGLIVAHNALTDEIVQRVVVVVPTQHLRKQWKDEAAKMGIQLDHRLENDGVEARDFDGSVVTYQQVAAAPHVHRHRCQRPTLVILDEPHHMSQDENKSWGPAVQQAFEPAVRRLLLTGTPFRTDGQPIPFVDYRVNDEGKNVCVPNFTYSYGQALSDGICRPVYFPSYDGRLKWWDGSSGEERDTTFREALSVKERARRLETALSPSLQWLPALLRDAHASLERIRRHQYQRAGGLVIAKNQDHAQAIARLLTEISGEPPALAISDDPRASEIIDDFRRSDQRWCVAVRMISEGVDVPRLCVGVYATNYLTELYFRQVVGRFVRLIAEVDDVAAYLFIPHDQDLVEWVQAIKQEREHAVLEGDEDDGTHRDAADRMPGTIPLFIPGTAEAQVDETFDPHGDTSYSPTEKEFAKTAIAIAGLEGMAPEIAARLLKTAFRLREVQSAPVSIVAPSSVPVSTAYEAPLVDRKKELRQQIRNLTNNLVQSTKAHGVEQKHIYMYLRNATGGFTADATLEQLEARRRLLTEWIQKANQDGVHSLLLYLRTR